MNGVDVYDFPELIKVSRRCYAIKRNVPQQVKFSKGGEWIVAGGDTGFARLVNASDLSIGADLPVANKKGSENPFLYHSFENDN